MEGDEHVQSYVESVGNEWTANQVRVSGGLGRLGEMGLMGGSGGRFGALRRWEG